MRKSNEKEAALDLIAMDETALSLPADRRSRILRQTMASRRGAVRDRLSAAGPLSARLHVASWAAVLACALLVVGTGYIWRPTETAAPPGTSSEAVDLTVTQVADAVVLEWADGSRDTFTVRQATSAGAVREAPGIQVRGTRYVDRSAAQAPVVYYLVE